MKGAKLVAIAIAFCALTGCQPRTEADKAEIAALLHKTFDLPDATLVLDPIAISGDTAIVDWTQGTMGGRALLRKHDGTWTLSMCGGEGLKTAEGLESAGVPSKDAVAIASVLAAAEARMTPARRRQLDSFGANVRMDSASEPKGH